MYALVSTDDLGRKVVLPLAKVRTSIGRDPGCDIVLPDANVSRQHAKIYVMEDKLEIKDMGSRNGTFVNNQRIEGMTVVRTGDEIIIGSNMFHVALQEGDAKSADMTAFRTLDQLREMDQAFLRHPAEGDEPGEAHVGDRTVVSSPTSMIADIYGKKLSLAQFPSLEVIYGANRGAKFLLPPGTYQIGRDKGNNIRVDDEKMSSRHAKIEVDAKHARFTDLGSTNGSILNNRLVTGATLRHKDVLVLGNTRLKYQDFRGSRRGVAALNAGEGDDETGDHGGGRAWVWAIVAVGAAVLCAAAWWLLKG